MLNKPTPLRCMTNENTLKYYFCCILRDSLDCKLHNCNKKRFPTMATMEKKEKVTFLVTVATVASKKKNAPSKT